MKNTGKTKGGELQRSRVFMDLQLLVCVCVCVRVCVCVYVHVCVFNTLSTKLADLVISLEVNVLWR